jgi:signal transduction histidine kinase
VSFSLSKRAGLRAGYAAVIAVLVLSAVEAYRIQTSTSEHQFLIYRHYVDRETSLATLRRDLWLAGNYVRDFFIHTTPEQARSLRADLAALRAEDKPALEHLIQVAPQSDLVRQFHRSLEQFWAVVDPLPDTMLGKSHEAHWQFLQEEIVPRRGKLYQALLDLTAADQQHLQESEKEFALARRRAAERLLGMLALSLLLALFVARKSIGHADNLEKRAQRHFAEVEQARQDLQQLSARLLEIEEEGKRRLSRELHDEIGQTLALLQIEISQLQSLLSGQPPVIRERLLRARELAGRTVQTIRNISGILRPALLDDLGLVPALQFQLEDFMRRSRIACDFSEDNVSEQLPDALKTCVYRVVQEALHNCEKHSGAAKVSVLVRQSASALSVRVEDNGCGFQLNEQGMPPRAAGLGLLGMRERVSIAGGTLSIDSAPGRGTRIAIQIPLISAATPPAAAASAIRQGVTA